MALTKQQAYALYFLLVSESSLVQNLRAANATTPAEFLTALQAEVTPLDAAAVIDPELAALYDGNAGGSTIIDQNAVSVLNSMPALGGDYGGGPCPMAGEQPAAWNALKAIP